MCNIGKKMGPEVTNLMLNSQLIKDQNHFENQFNLGLK